MGVIGIVKGSEGGFINNLGSEREIRSFIWVEFVQLLYSGER